MLYMGKALDSNLVFRFSTAVDFDRDLPENIFILDDYMFWFFERPFLYSGDLFEGLAMANKSFFQENLVVSFGDPRNPTFAYFVFENTDLNIDWLELRRGFSDFFGSQVDYPVVVSNLNLDWFAFESAYEELGVLAVPNSLCKNGFADFLNENFITCEQIIDLASTEEGWYETLAGLLQRSYCVGRAS